MNAAGRLYLDFMVAADYPEQEPAHKAARNRDLLWLLIPIVGFMIFILAIEDRYKKTKGLPPEKFFG